MKKILSFVFVGLLFCTYSHAAYESRFDAVNFDPAIDGGDYYTVYGSQNLKPWQGNAGFYIDYAYRPLEFRRTGGGGGRQSVLDGALFMNAYGAMGFTDWFEAGINIPIGLYNWYFTDDATAADDSGGSMGDVLIMTKFRAIDISKHRVGLSFVPYLTLPTGDVVRYSGNGHITGGLNMILDGRLHERLSMSLNLGYLMRDDVTRNYVFPLGATATVRVDDLFTYGAAANVRFTKNFQGIVEAHGWTLVRDFFGTASTNSLEAVGGLRYYFGDSGFSIDAGGGAGLLDGVGTPLFRAFGGLRWTSPVPQPCPVCNAPDPRIQGNKIVIWGKIFFDTAKATIKTISYPVLDDVVDVLNKHPEITLVEVQGHTDARGSDAYNMKLSQARSESSMRYLISKGIDPSRLHAVGYGESRPIASNSTVEGMSQNRRTEFVIMSSTNNSFTTQAVVDAVSTVVNSVVNQINPAVNESDPNTPSLEETAPSITPQEVQDSLKNNMSYGDYSEFTN